MVYDLDSVRRIAAKHCLEGELSLMHDSGMVNEAWAIGGQYVLRINKVDDAEGEAEREALVVPLVIAAGIRTPELIAMELKSDIVPRPYTIYRRAPGKQLGDWEIDPAQLVSLYEELGRELVALHQVSVPQEGRDLLERDRDWGMERQLQKALDEGKLSAREGEEIAELVEWLTPLCGAPEAETLAHVDIHPWNLMADEATNELTAFLDWGDARIYDPSIDFASMPLVAVNPMLRAYREAGGQMDEGFLARIMFRSVGLACFEVRCLEIELYKRQWWRMPPGGWAEMRRYLVVNHPELVPPRWRC